MHKKDITVVRIVTDSQASLKQIPSHQPGPGQALALSTMRWESDILERNIPVEYCLVPADKGIEGNEQVEQQATKAVCKHCGSHTEMQKGDLNYDFVTFAHVS